MPKKVDRNQAEIVTTLRCFPGVKVQHLFMIGRGCPDIMAGYKGRNYLFEIKMPGATLTPDEVVWHATWCGQVDVITDARQALKIMGVIE